MARYTVDQFRAEMRHQPQTVRVEADYGAVTTTTITDKENELCGRWETLYVTDAIYLICCLYRDRISNRFRLEVDAGGVGMSLAYELIVIPEFRHKVSVVPWNHR